MEVKMTQKQEKAKRIRRNFGTIIMDKLEAYTQKFDQSAELTEILRAIEDQLNALEQLKKKSNSNKKKFRVLNKFSKEELKAYIKSL